jgi:hypothetical protein
MCRWVSNVYLFLLLFLLALLLAASSACAKARHVAVVADQSVAAAVFAVDDGRREACQAQVLPAPTCMSLAITVLHAEQAVRAATAALQAAKPDEFVVPADLVTVLSDLQSVQAVVAPLKASPGVGALAAKVDAAIGAASQLITNLIDRKAAAGAQ